MDKEYKNLKLVWMQEGIEVLGKLLTSTLQLTEKGDKYTLLFKKDVDQLILSALREARQKYENA